MSPAWRQTLRRGGRLAAGGALLVVGAVLVPLPGPGLPVVAAGLLVLAPELPWARRARRRLLEVAVRARRLSAAGRRRGARGAEVARG